ncbi:extracellular solute-binding protein [Anaeromicropila populeti]|uniref:Diguanylate cyclase (GGDEF) domain-containing protein n=1 Tax=Anaeromicropila populeti TaxID=37658 RepID=A0A1I6I8B2_9FIRM|nr:extracellular solute-binding protein [Anaeromicropila populeti]SFR62911.1 diguanylate cyclase (GGDEF) domain-containing protein [Anaeromicropila populeti]
MKDKVLKWTKDKPPWVKWLICLISILYVVVSVSQTIVASESTGDKQTIVVYTNQSKEILQPYKEAFEKKYNNVSVVYKCPKDYETEVTQLLQEGNCGDVLLIPGSISSSEYGKYFKSLGSRQQMELKYNYINSTNGTQVYGLPTFANALGLVYNKAVFEQAGITELPATIEDFYNDMEKIKERTEATPLYTNYASGWALGIWEEYTFGSMTGDSTYRNNGFLNEEKPFSKNTAHFKVYKLLYDLVANGLCEDNPEASNWDQSKKLLNEGKIGCMALGTWAVSQIKAAGPFPENVCYMPFPHTINGKQYMTVSADYSYAISRTSSNQEMARKYIDFMIEESGYAINNQCISIVKSDPYPESFSEMNNVNFLVNSQFTSKNYSRLLELSAKLDLSDTANQQRIVEAALYKRNETFEEIMDEWNEIWESGRTIPAEKETPVISNQGTIFDITGDYEIRFSLKEQELFQEADTITVGYVDDMPPLAYFCETKREFCGISADVLKILEQKTGLQLEYKAYASDEEMLQAAKNGEIQLLVNVGKWEQKPKEKITFSKTFLSDTMVLVKNKEANLEEIQNKPLAVLKGEILPAELTVDEKNIKYYDTVTQCFEAVNQNKASYTFINYYTANYYSIERRYKNISVIPLNYKCEVSIGFVPGADSRMISITNKVLYGISDGTYQRIVQSNLSSIKDIITVRHFVEANPIASIFGSLAVLSIVALLVIFLLYQRLRLHKKNAITAKRYEILAELADEYFFEYQVQKNILTLTEKLQSKFGTDAVIELDYYENDNQTLNSFLEILKMAKDRELKEENSFCCSMPDGDQEWFCMVYSYILDEKNAPTHLIGKITNVTKSVQEKKILTKKAQTDPLTGLFNREGFQSKIDVLQNAAGMLEDCTLIMLDLDYFKLVNDTLGHAGGDFALTLMADKMAELFPEEAIKCRYGGDEFIVFIDHCSDKEKIEELCKTFCETIHFELEYETKKAKLSVSMGVKISSVEITFKQLMFQADEQLYLMKKEGRNGYRINS